MPEDELAKGLQSPNLETRFAAIERASIDPGKYAQSVVDLIPRFPKDGYFVLERVGRFGDAIIPPLLALAESTTDVQIRLLANLGLAHFKRHVNSAILLDAVRSRSEYQCLACRALGWLGDSELIPELLMELRNTSPALDWDRTVSLVGALESLGAAVPQPERERLISEGPPLTKRMLDAKPKG
jgi:hypothetical protein